MIGDQVGGQKAGNQKDAAQGSQGDGEPDGHGMALDRTAHAPTIGTAYLRRLGTSTRRPADFRRAGPRRSRAWGEIEWRAWNRPPGHRPQGTCCRGRWLAP